MAINYKFLVTILLWTTINAQPIQLDSDSVVNINDDSLLNIESANDPNLYLIIAEAVDDDTNMNNFAYDNENVIDDVEKRSAEDNDDLQTAAGTNVLRPLFVYRQQLAYRERRKGARGLGIRPRF